MVVEAPPPPAVPDLDVNATGQDVDAGVIEDARRRQRRHQQIGGSVLALAAAGALLVGMGAGGSGSGGQATARSSSGGQGRASGHAATNSAFPGAPSSQRNGYGVESNSCPLAPPNRYLPARAGCVFVRLASMNGDGRPDLVIVYSILSHRHPNWSGGTAASAIARNFVPLRAYVKVVLPGGATTTERIRGGPGSDTAEIAFVTHITGVPGDELFLRVQAFADGATELAYGLRSGHIVAAGVPLPIGADGGSRMRFNCLGGGPPRLATHTFMLLGPNVYGWWKEIDVVYRWRAARLVRISSRSFRRHGYVADSAASFRTGCPQVKA